MTCPYPGTNDGIMILHPSVAPFCEVLLFWAHLSSIISTCPGGSAISFTTRFVLGSTLHRLLLSYLASSFHLLSSLPIIFWSHFPYFISFVRLLGPHWVSCSLLSIFPYSESVFVIFPSNFTSWPHAHHATWEALFKTDWSFPEDF